MNFLGSPFALNNVSPISLDNNWEYPKNALDPETKLPYHSFYVFPYHNKIKYINLARLFLYINKKFEEIEGIRVKYNEHNFKWEVQWGTEPLRHQIKDYNLNRIIQTKQECAFQAAQVARQKFGFIPHFVSHELWFKAEIHLSYLKESNEILIEYNRLAGDSRSFYSTMSVIKEYFDDPIIKLWIEREEILAERINYLMFIEGTIKNINESMYNNISRLKYIYDDNLIKEICTFL